MVKTPTQPITLAAFLELPETKPASEYTNGQVIQKPMPQGEHSTLQRDLTRALDDQLSPTKIARAYPELRSTYPSGSHLPDVYGGRSIVPDISVYQWGKNSSTT